ncbi:hypothetical protein DS2_17357 [Catenovulum agarivorans DS-2]|uniref:Solute-binding protein family 3/N-terminal domain-containing protein n=1 Tax=Catenovulum agarivorans DS-2 TaxID=1328313 RepID=W7QHP6_9ALTE|nr:hypothetical protein [Catenovulum agarivorans]EWH08457.1 hypothetical protein DS2_17357 [Catenovulum agarivorans DS-2]
MLLLLSNYCAADSKAQITQVRYNHYFSFEPTDKLPYYPALLNMALQLTQAEYGPYELIPIKLDTTQGRSLKLLEQNKYIDVHWSVSNLQRERTLTAIYVPIQKGLMGYRISLIRKGEQARFSHITSIDDLKGFRLGQGFSWPDSAILKANQLMVVHANAENLHSMLQKQRIDLFPRSFTQAWREVNSFENLAVESSFVISYLSPMYFFVNKQQQVLARRLEEGLIEGLKNGQFDQLFYTHRAPAQTFIDRQLSSRTHIKLVNPQLSARSLALRNNPLFWAVQPTQQHK